jgi:membrane-bound ClpP family serine protease
MAETRSALLLDLEGSLSPATARFIQHTYQQALDTSAELLVFRVNDFKAAPHVLSSISSVMNQAQIPVIAYVETANLPNAAMQKILNQSHFVVYHNKGAALHDDDCCVVDGLSELVSELHGQHLSVNDTIHVLSTENLVLQKMQLDWQDKILFNLISPNIIFLLIVITLHAFLFEWARPGNIRAATIGSVCLLLSLVAMQYQVASYAALLGLFTAVFLMFLELYKVRTGLIGLAGIALYFYSASGLIDAPDTYKVNIEIIIISFILLSGMLLMTVSGCFHRKYR